MGQSFGQVKAAPRGGEAGGLKGLNSMRAFGVVLVLVYHFFPSILPGGFIGVDIFFVVSGYLITSLLIRESGQSGGLRLLDFFRRRWLRLFPAIVAMLLVSLPFSLLIPSDFRTGIARQAAASLSWATNYYEIFTGQSYEAQLLPHLFIHTWTLSVEMQYYIFWGVISTAIVLFVGRRARRQRDASSGGNAERGRVSGKGHISMRVTLMSVAVVVAALSALCMQHGAARAADPSVAYMSTLSHLFPLMIGSAFGCLFGFSPLIPPRKWGATRGVRADAHGLPATRASAAHLFRIVSLLAIAVGVGAMTFLSFTFSFRDPRVYPYGILAVSFITAAILCLARIGQDLSPRREPGVTNYIGLRSYSIYLFHWPIMIVARQLPIVWLDAAPGAASVWGAVVGIPATFIAAELSYRWVEQPFRARRRSAYATGAAAEGIGAGGPRRRIASACVAAALIAVSLNAVTTAPRISSIESDLRYGAMRLDVSNLQGLYEDVAAGYKGAAPDGGAKAAEGGGNA
jgi:peptidoglycan/LPS O-acetylase OafA/YrhL